MSQHEIREEREARESRSIAPPKPEDEQLSLFGQEARGERQESHIKPPCWVELGFPTFEAYMAHLDHIAQAALDGEPIPAT